SLIYYILLNITSYYIISPSHIRYFSRARGGEAEVVAPLCLFVVQADYELKNTAYPLCQICSIH
ncbi:MAG: hypothetical protein ACYDG2_25120, partial [Ruminiclostridium sp.]